ncbi:MAG TPA: hypothetical protein VM577_15550 [Anaerovoracaceae bacterium]|nr:hypothetical protein [Anaerovoracaceae bacterium]
MADLRTTSYDVVTNFVFADGYACATKISPNNISLTYSEATNGPKWIKTYFMMRWLDVDCSPTITYRTWVVVDNPDPTGLQYGGTKCGATAITGAIIAATWSAPF